MQINSESPRSLFPEHSSDASDEQPEKGTAQTARKNSEKSGSRNGGTSITQTAKEKNPQAPATPRRVLPAPVVQSNRTGRPRSNSQPELLRPLPDLANPASLASPTPEGKSSSSNRRSRDAESVKSSSSALSTSSRVQDPTSTTPPRLQIRKPNPARKSLTPEQQISHDLADLADKHLLRKSGRVDDDIDPSQMTLGLQKYAGKPAHTKVRIDDLMLKMFGEDMKKTEAWEIARQTSVKIKTAYFLGRDESFTVDEKKAKEAIDQLRFLASSMAGAFFNVSGTAENIRLPQPLKHFLCEMDYRQIRKLLSSDAGINMSHDDFLRARRDSLSLVLLDAFLIPLLAKEFFPVRKTIESDTAMAHVIESLHSAWSVSSPVLLKNSLDSAPNDIAELMLKRRSNQFRPQAYTKLTSMPSAATSPKRLRRTELRALLEQLQKQLSPISLTPKMLKAIKAFNNEFSTEKGVISSENLYPQWLEIIEAIDPESEAALQIREWVDIDQGLLEIDILSKLAKIEETGTPLAPERARRLTSDRPLLPLPVSTASIDTANVSLFESPRIIALAEKRKDRRSPASPQSKETKHARNRTDNGALQTSSKHLNELTSKQQKDLLAIYPNLLLENCIKPAATNGKKDGQLKSDLVAAISEAGRGKLVIDFDQIPLAIRVKITPSPVKGASKKMISHTDLLNLLLMDALQSSPAGRAVQNGLAAYLQQVRTESAKTAVSSSGSTATTEFSPAFLPPPNTNALVSAIFGQGLSKAGLPEELITLCKSFDKSISDWIAILQAPLTKADTDTLRSNLIFDLIGTRLLYRLVMTTTGLTRAADEARFSTEFKKSFKNCWDNQLFNDFKAMQGETVAENKASVTASDTSGSTSQTPSARQ